MRSVANQKGKCVYLNSGDWIENLTALEYHNESWRLYQYNPEKFTLNSMMKAEQSDKKSTTEVLSAFQQLLKLS